jgi:hypothetical protein
LVIVAVAEPVAALKQVAAVGVADKVRGAGSEMITVTGSIQPEESIMVQV